MPDKAMLLSTSELTYANSTVQSGFKRLDGSANATTLPFGRRGSDTSCARRALIA